MRTQLIHVEIVRLGWRKYIAETKFKGETISFFGTSKKRAGRSLIQYIKENSETSNVRAHWQL